MSDKPENEETLMTFPCDFTIKIIGKASDTFEAEVITLVRKHFPNLGEGAVRHNHSKENNYLALSVHLTADSKQQLDGLYKDLSDSPLVIFAL